MTNSRSRFRLILSLSILAASLITQTQLATAKPKVRSVPFPLLGGVALGNLEYVSFTKKPNRQLEKALRSTGRYITTYDLNSVSARYSYATTDLNGDGRADALVYIYSDNGSGGWHVSIFQATNSGYQIVGRILHTWALIITPAKTSGWNNIVRVPGKIGFDPDSFYVKCRYDPRRQSEPKNNSFSGKYENCQKSQRRSVLSGRIILPDASNTTLWHKLGAR